jgi:hypothetical protein
MTIKLALLKSGEDVIADMQEVFVDEGKMVGYLFENPCVVKVISYDEDTTSKKIPCKIQLTSWIPLSKDQKVLISGDWVITVVEPIDRLKELYETGIAKNGNENYQDSSINEQYDSHQSD